MITPGQEAKILDFGLAKPIGIAGDDSSLTAVGCVVGTCRSMSPEQARGAEVDERSDLFSLGVLIYEMLTGSSPFQGSNALATLTKVISERPPCLDTLRPGLPPRLVALVFRLLAKEPDDRPQSAAEVARELDAIAAALAPSGDPALEETLTSLPTEAVRLWGEGSHASGRSAPAGGVSAAGRGAFTRGPAFLEAGDPLVSGGAGRGSLFLRNRRHGPAWRWPKLLVYSIRPGPQPFAAARHCEPASDVSSGGPCRLVVRSTAAKTAAEDLLSRPLTAARSDPRSALTSICPVDARSWRSKLPSAFFPSARASRPNSTALFAVEQRSVAPANPCLLPSRFKIDISFSKPPAGPVRSPPPSGEPTRRSHIPELQARFDESQGRTKQALADWREAVKQNPSWQNLLRLAKIEQTLGFASRGRAQPPESSCSGRRRTSMGSGACRARARLWRSGAGDAIYREPHRALANRGPLTRAYTDLGTAAFFSCTARATPAGPSREALKPRAEELCGDAQPGRRRAGAGTRPKQRPEAQARTVENGTACGRAERRRRDDQGAMPGPSRAYPERPRRSPESPRAESGQSRRSCIRGAGVHPCGQLRSRAGNDPGCDRQALGAKLVSIASSIHSPRIRGSSSSWARPPAIGWLTFREIGGEIGEAALVGRPVAQTGRSPRRWGCGRRRGWAPRSAAGRFQLAGRGRRKGDAVGRRIRQETRTNPGRNLISSVTCVVSEFSRVGNAHFQRVESDHRPQTGR